MEHNDVKVKNFIDKIYDDTSDEVKQYDSDSEWGFMKYDYMVKNTAKAVSCRDPMRTDYSFVNDKNGVCYIRIDDEWENSRTRCLVCLRHNA